jgi:dTMP kinase
VLVDRFDRRRVMIVADLARAALALILVFTNSLWVIYLAVLAMETASLFFWPARNSLIPYLVDEDDITAANGLAYTTQQASMLIGLTAAAGILAGFEAVVRFVLASDLPVVNQILGIAAPALLGPRAGVILDVLTFLISATLISTIRTVARPPQYGEPIEFSLIGRDVVESFRFLGEHRELRGLLVTIGLAILGGGAIVPVGQTYVQENLTGALPFSDRIEGLQQLTATPMTFMLVFMALGMVTGALFAQRLERKVRLQLLFPGSVAAFGLSLFGFASVNYYWLAGIFAALAGACIAMVSVSANSYIIRTTSDEIRGRTFTAFESVIRVALLLSMIVMAPLADLIGGFVEDFVMDNGLAPASVTMTGSRITLQISALVVVAAAVYGFRVLRWKECEPDDPAAPVAVGEGAGA